MTGGNTKHTDLGRLEEELDFLLRSLADLDAEHAAGGLSDRRYERLRGQYTVRAAEIARATERPTTPTAGTAARRRVTAASPRRRRSAGRRTRTRRGRIVPVIAALALAGLGAGGGAGMFASPATPGQATTAVADPTVAALQRTVQQNPRSADARDALADALAQTGDLTGALREFDTAASLDPTDPVALSYSGWIALLAGSPDKALARLAEAESADPGYPDAHAFRGIALLRAGDDATEAVRELQRYLQLAPGGPMTQQVQDVLAQVGQSPPPRP